MNNIQLTDEQLESIVSLINGEIESNIENGDDAYNSHWEDIKMALGYAITK